MPKLFVAQDAAKLESVISRGSFQNAYILLIKTMAIVDVTFNNTHE